MKAQKKRIDGYVYKVTPFTGRSSFRIQMKLARLLSPSLGLLAGMFSGGKKAIKELAKNPDNKDLQMKSLLDLDLDGELIGKAFSGLFNQCSEDELLDLLLMILEKTERGDEGNEVFITEESFDAFFAQNLLSAFKVAVFVIQVNYPDFFALAALTGSETDQTDG